MFSHKPHTGMFNIKNKINNNLAYQLDEVALSELSETMS